MHFLSIPFHFFPFLSFHLVVTWMNQSHIEMRLYACRFRADVWQSMILIFIAFFVLCANGYKPNYHSQSHLRAPSMPLLQLDWCSLTVLLEIDKLAITLDPWLKVTRFRVAVSWKTKWNKTALNGIHFTVMRENGSMVRTPPYVEETYLFTRFQNKLYASRANL